MALSSLHGTLILTARTVESIVMAILMVVCAVLASLALGVLVAYGVCQAMFRVFRGHAIRAAEARAGQRLRVARG